MMNLPAVLTELDTRILFWSLRQRHHQRSLRVVRLWSCTGDGYLQCLFVISLLGLAQVRPELGTLPLAYIFMILLAGERAAYWVLKNALQRPRPPDAIDSFSAVIKAADRFSFPSGHTSAAFLLAGCLYQMVDNVFLIVAVFLWAAGVGASRVLLGVHYPSDIVAGVILGLSFASLL